MLDLVGLRGSGEALAREGAACDKRQVVWLRIRDVIPDLRFVPYRYGLTIDGE